jgi:signal transduction histidine kinase
LKGKIRIELSRTGNVIRLSISDTGVGIAAEDMWRIFTKGGKGSYSSTINAESTGYGLYFAKTIVEAHQGRIWAESEGRNKGSRFFVEFPAI